MAGKPWWQRLESADCSPPSVRKQREMNASPAHSFLVIQPGIPARGAVPPEFMVGPPISVNPEILLQTC